MPWPSDTTRARVTIFEGSPHVLGMYPEELSRKAERQLTELGVEVRTNSAVTAVEPGRIEVGGEWIPVKLTLWATGVVASPLSRRLGAAAAQQGVAVGRNIVREIGGGPRIPFRYLDLGSMATIGRHRAVAVMGPLPCGCPATWRGCRGPLSISCCSSVSGTGWPCFRNGYGRISPGNAVRTSSPATRMTRSAASQGTTEKTIHEEQGNDG